MNILQLMVQLGVKGTGAVTGALDQVESHAHGAAEGVHHAGESVHAAEEKFEHFELPVLEAVFALQQFISVAKEAAATAAEFSGLKAASEWNRVQMSLENVTGSAEKARDMLKELKEIGAETGFSSQDLARVAPQLVNSGVAPEMVPEQVKSIANLAALGNLGRDQIPGFLETMTRMRNMDHPMVRQLESLNGLPIQKLVNAGAGTHFKNANQAYDFLASTGLGQGYKILLKGADALGKDAAAMQKVRDPALALAKTLETLEEAMAPTGALLLKALTPVGAAMGWLAEQVERVNTVTGGAAGLIAIIILLVRHHRLLVGSVKAAIRYTRELAESLERYGEAAQFAAHATGAHGAAGAAKEASEVAHVAEGGSLIARMTKPLTGMLAAVKAFAKNPVAAVKAGKGVQALSLAKLFKVADIATFLAGMGLETLGDHMRKDGRQTRAGAITQGVGEGVGFGGLGFFLGPIVGLATTLAGAAIGGIVGNNRFSHAPAEDKQTKAVEENTDALIELKGTLVGGGKRGNAEMGRIEMERAVARAMAGMA